jgi:hypothetical protein
MDTHSIIKQLTEQLSNSPVEQERISHLAPIELVLLNLNKDVKIKVDEKHTFLCVPALEKSKGKGDVSYDDIEYLKITDEKLFELLEQYDQNNINEFIEYLNKEIFKYIQKEIRKAKDLEAWDSDNMWYEPNKRFTQWFDLRAINFSKSAPLEKKPKIPNSVSQKKSKGGRPKDPDLPNKKNRLRKDYYKLTQEQGYKATEAINSLTIIYKWKKSTIETYLKK